MKVKFFGAMKGKGTSEKGKGNPFDFAQLVVPLTGTSFENQHVHIQSLGEKTATLPITAELFDLILKINPKRDQELDVDISLVEYKGRFSPLGVGLIGQK